MQLDRHIGDGDARFSSEPQFSVFPTSCPVAKVCVFGREGVRLFPLIFVSFEIGYPKRKLGNKLLSTSPCTTSSPRDRATSVGGEVLFRDSDTVLLGGYVMSPFHVL